jgi:hypothetical protein
MRHYGDGKLMAKKDKKDKKEKQQQKKNMGAKGHTILIFSALLSVVFMQTALLFAVGMLPTAIATLMDKTGRNTLAITVGAMNLAGCSPFMFQMWLKGHTLDLTLSIISDPKSIAVMYASAGMGYLLNWAISGAVEAVMSKQAQARLKAIGKRKKHLTKKWGAEVTGEVEVDNYGFPVEDEGA